MTSCSQCTPGALRHPSKSDSVVNFTEDDFARQVLRLAIGDSEDAFNARLLEDAQRFGLSVDDIFDQPRDTYSPSSEDLEVPPRSHSTDSHQTNASSIVTFDLSKGSQNKLENICASPSDFRHSSDVSSAKDHASRLWSVRNKAVRSSTFSGSTLFSDSTQSLPSSSDTNLSARRNPRRAFLRGLSRLRPRRTHSVSSIQSQCSQCTDDNTGAVPKTLALPCGHAYCVHELRKMTMAAADQQVTGIPTCCGKTISRSTIEAVGSRSHENSKRESYRMSVASSINAMDTHPPLPTAQRQPNISKQRPRTMPAGSGVLMTQESYTNLEKALEIPEFRSMREAQEQQRDRCVAWETKHQDQLRAVYSRRKEEVNVTFDRQREAVEEEHMATMAHVEDKHVAAEATLRDNHEAEKRNAATALKHMEAYCARSLSGTDQPHNRPITEQDRQELEKARRARDGLVTKHQSAINVLRGEQGLRLQIRTQRQTKELNQLDAKQRDQLALIDNECDYELSQVRKDMDKRRKRIELSWSVETQMWRKRLEQDTGVYFQGELPPVAWDEIHFARVCRSDTVPEPLGSETVMISTRPGAKAGSLDMH